MSQTQTTTGSGILGKLFLSHDVRQTRRKARAAARKRQRETDLKVAKDLRETGYFDEHLPDAYFFRHHYF